MSDRDDLIARLATHRGIGSSPMTELEWLADNGRLREYAAGDQLIRKGEAADEMFVVLSGHGAMYLDRGSGKRKFLEWGPGDVTGLLPFSRLRVAQGEAIIDQALEVVVIHRDRFPELVRACPTVTEHIVHAMLDRARHFTSTDSHDEKLMSLGRLSAGLSHELNNPASAAERSAQILVDAIARANEAAMALARARLSDTEYDTIVALRNALEAHPATSLSPLERADREDAIGDWLADHDIDAAEAPALAESGLSPGSLDELSQSIPAHQLETALRWLTTDHAARSLARDVERAAHRIYHLVSAVKRFTYMDRAGVSAPVDVAGTIADTVTMFGAKAKAKKVVVSVDVQPSLPPVDAFGAELNQVWSNLIDNALDAVSEGGHVDIVAVMAGSDVVVRVVDDGPGISGVNLPRVFDPFFTTKPVGHGTGLGLDIARRIIRRHDGQIEVDSRPGRTEFRVTVPVKRAVTP